MVPYFKYPTDSRAITVTQTTITIAATQRSKRPKLYSSSKPADPEEPSPPTRYVKSSEEDENSPTSYSHLNESSLADYEIDWERVIYIINFGNRLVSINKFLIHITLSASISLFYIN